MAYALCGRFLLPKRLPHLSVVRNNGYIVLLPEIGEDSPQKLGLVQSDGLPEFNDVTIEKCMTLIAKQTLEFEAGVKLIEGTIEKKKNNLNIFPDVFDNLEELGAPLDMTWGLAKTLYLGNSTLMPSSSYLAIHERAKRARANKYHSLAIYEAVSNELNDKKQKHSREQERLLQKFALEGKLNGVKLSSKSRTALSNRWEDLNMNKGQFRKKIEYVTSQFSHILEDQTVVREFPLELLKAVSSNIQEPLKGPWKFTLQPNVYMGVLEHCPDRDVRWNLWQALVGRGSGFGSQELSTSVNLEGIRNARRDIANILGYKTFAEMSMETKMAGNVENVIDTLKALLRRSKPAQEQELEDLYAFAIERGFKGGRIELWDLPYWRRKHLKTVFEFNEELYKDYFPLPKVLHGMYQLCEKLFNIKIKKRNDVSTWSKDVKYYDIYEDHTSAPIGGFYFDPYAREREKLINPQNTGWMVGIQNQRLITETKPLAALIFNFDPPRNEQESYLSLKEVKYLFHKFGMTLQHLLTRTDYSEVSGSSNIEWDAVEVSGHLLANWLQDKNVIDSISCHSSTKDHLPDAMYEAMINAQKHLTGVELSRELYLATLDLELHRTNDYWLDIVKRLWPQFRSFPLDKLDSHPCSFTQIFTEEWGAAYYSRLWSRMLAADIYSAFHENDHADNKVLEVGKRFRDTFLLYGGSCHPSKTFREFRGRDPSPKALLGSLGLSNVKAE